MKAASPLFRALISTQEEAALLLLLWSLAFGISRLDGVGSTDMRLWMAMIIVQSLPYLAAIAMAVVSTLPRAEAVVDAVPGIAPAQAESP